MAGLTSTGAWATRPRQAIGGVFALWGECAMTGDVGNLRVLNGGSFLTDGQDIMLLIRCLKTLDTDATKMYNGL